MSEELFPCKQRETTNEFRDGWDAIWCKKKTLFEGSVVYKRMSDGRLIEVENLVKIKAGDIFRIKNANNSLEVGSNGELDLKAKSNGHFNSDGISEIEIF